MRGLFAREKTLKDKILALTLSAGVHAIILYRLSARARSAGLLRRLRVDLLIYRLNQFLCNTDIDPGVQIGEQLLLPHPSGIVIGGTAIIGSRVTIMQNVTIGARVLGVAGKRHATIEDDVFIGPNTVILGNVTIKRGAQIGACSLILADVDAGAKIFGVHK